MVLARFTRPGRGSVRFDEREVIRTPPHLRDVGMVFQNYAPFPHMSVAGNASYPLRTCRLPPAEIAGRVERALEDVQLGGYGERRIDQLSGGQMQRVALARAIVFERRILLMDQPLSATATSLSAAFLTVLVATPVGVLAAYGLYASQAKLARGRPRPADHAR
jgi:putative spermidine/putrescine transport system ATP-binding protein